MYQKDPQGWLRHWDFILLDLVVLQLSFLLAYVIRHQNFALYGIAMYRSMAVSLEVTDLLLMLLFNFYEPVMRRGKFAEFAATVKHAVGILLIASFYLILIQESDFSRITLFLTASIYLFGCYFLKLLLKRCIRHCLHTGRSRFLYIVASGATAENAVRNILENNNRQYDLLGVIAGDNTMSEEILGIPVVSDVEYAAEYLCKNWCDELYVVCIPYPSQLVKDCMDMGITVHTYIADGMDYGNNQSVQRVGRNLVFTTSVRNISPLEAITKRTMDIIGAVIGCILTALIAVILGPAIYISSPDPVIFKQERIGQNGKHFQMYKFRSMYPDTEEKKNELLAANRIADGHMFKVDFDPRVIGNQILADGTYKTGIGDFIRRTSLDEFPQFFNVLKGDMSLVGTRPPTIDEIEKYDLHHKSRLSVKPGITGMWQISGRSEITDFEKVVELDTWYIRNWNIWLDLKILLKTVFVVFNRKGSM